MQIVEGIYQVDGVNANSYILVNGNRLTLIDVGLPRNSKKILSFIESMGHKPEDLATIIVTHYHFDHVGSIRQLKEATHAKIAVQQQDANVVSGKVTPPKSKNLFFRAFSAFIKPATFEPDIILNDGDEVDGLTVFHTPGHTMGSICLLDKKRRVLFSGDALRLDKGKVELSPENYNVDTQLAKESIGKIANLDFEILLAGHGPALMKEGAKEVQELLQIISNK